MPTEIKTITEAQQARFPEWVDRWINVGLSCEPADFNKAKEAALAAYRLAGLEEPKLVLFSPSIYQACIDGVKALISLAKTDEEREQLRANSAASFDNLSRGALWAGWASYVSFLRDVLEWEDPTLANFAIDEALIMSCGYVWWHEDVCVIVDRPKEIHRDGAGNLHNLTGPAISWRDGQAFYFVHGVAVQAEWILKPQELKPEMALTWSNIEERRALAEIIGWDKILAQLKPRVIDRDKNPEIGVLLEVDLPDAPKSRFLQVVCGTGRTFVLPVSNTAKTALQANADTYGISDIDLTKLEVRT